MKPVCPQNLDGRFPVPFLPVWFQNGKNYMNKKAKNMSEDCLYLNIYVPIDFYMNGES